MRDACQSLATRGLETGPPTSVPPSSSTASTAAAITAAARRFGVAGLPQQSGRRTTNTYHSTEANVQDSATKATYTAVATPEWRDTTETP